MILIIIIIIIKQYSLSTHICLVRCVGIYSRSGSKSTRFRSRYAVQVVVIRSSSWTRCVSEVFITSVFVGF